MMTRNALLASLLLLASFSAHAALKVSIVTAAAANGTPTYTQDFTDSTTFGGATPAAAVCYSANGGANDTKTSHARFTLGAVANSVQAVVANGTINNATSNSGIYSSNAKMYAYMSSSSAVTGVATAALIADGVRFSWTAQSSGETIHCLLIGGQVEASVANLTSNNGTGAQTVTHGLTGTPDAIIAFTGDIAAAAPTQGDARLGIGFWTAGAQVGYARRTLDAVSTGDSHALLSNTTADNKMGAATTLSYTGTIASVGATTFTVTHSVANVEQHMFLSLRSTDGTPLGVKAGTFTAKTSTGTQADVTSLGQAGQAMITVATRLTAVNTGDQGDPSGGFTFGAAVKNTGTGSTQYGSAGFSIDDGASTAAYAQSQVSTTAGLRILAVDGSLGTQATISSWDSGGLTHNYGTVDAAAEEVMYLALGGDVNSTLSAVSIGTRTATTIPVNVTNNTTETTYGVALTAGATAPTCAKVLLGQTASGSAAPYSASVAATATVATSMTFTGMDGGPWDIYVCGASTVSPTALTNSYKLPNWTSAPAIGSRTSSSITYASTVDITGTTYGVMVASGDTAPSAAQIIAGQNHAGTSALAAANSANTLNVSLNLALTGLTTAPLDAYFVDVAGSQNSAVDNVTGSYKTPAFSVALSAAATTGGYTISGTLDGAGTKYAVACLHGSSAATVAQVKAAQCTGNAAALASGNANASATIALTGLTLPIYDVYGAGNYGSQDSALTTLASQLKLPPAGKQYTTLASVSATSFCNSITSPSVAASDIVVDDLVTTPGGFTITQLTDCNLNYTGDASRQEILYDIYDDSAGGFMAGGPAQLWFNDLPPIVTNPTPTIALQANVAMSAIDFCGSLFGSPQGDTLTCTSSDTGTGTGADKRPAGTSISAGVWSGTPTVAATGSFTMTATDLASATNTIAVSWQVLDVVATPDCTGLDISACTALYDADFISWQLDLQCHSSVAAGKVYSQSPAAGASVAPFSTGTLTAAQGGCTTRRMGLSNSISIRP